MTEPVEELKILPEWRQAVRDFLAAGFKEGDFVPHSWLEHHFGMGPLVPDAEVKVSDLSARQFAWLRNVEAFRAASPVWPSCGWMGYASVRAENSVQHLL